MRTRRINADVLVGERKPGGPEPPGLSLTRRQVLGLAGAAAAAMMPGAKELGSGVSVESNGTRAAILLGGRERFAVDAGLFGGRPRLDVVQLPDRTTVTLAGATFPGTVLPADLTADMERRPSGWWLRLQLAGLGFVAEVPLAAWLSGAEPARATVRLDGFVCPPGVAAYGPAHAEFGPDWKLRLSGPGVALLTDIPGLEGPARGDSLTVALLTPFAPSLVKRPVGRRTLITLERGANRWRFAPPANWPLAPADNAFDMMRVEAGIGSDGKVRCTMLAEAAHDEARLHFTPGGGWTDLEAKPFALALTRPRYAVSDGPGGREAVLAAGYSRTPAWASSGGLSLLVGDGAAASPFTLTAQGNGAPQLECAPALLQAAAPLEGALTRVQLAPGSRAVFATTVRPPNQIPIEQEPKITEILVLPFSLSVMRPADLLSLTFQFFNLKLVPGSPAQLVRVNQGKPAYIVAHFPPQHIAEQVLDEDSSGQITGATNSPLKARLAGPSRLAFAIPFSTSSVPYTLESLLAWTALVPSVVPTALPTAPSSASTGAIAATNLGINLLPNISLLKYPVVPNAGVPITATNPAITEPTETQTVIEAPYRLVLSPNGYAAWTHATAPVSRNGRTELWHTRLAVRSGEAGGADEVRSDLRTVRAVWSPDFKHGGPAPAGTDLPFAMPLNARDRHMLVGVSADCTNPAAPKPVQVNRLMLSALGAWLDLQGAWKLAEIQPKYSVIDWRQVTAMGRDQFVRIIDAGYLYPFGHAAVLITISERKFQTVNGQTRAFLARRRLIAVREPEIDYSKRASLFMYGARELPFRKVRITTAATPLLDPVGKGVGNRGAGCFWPAAGKQDVLFHLEGEDHAGQTVRFVAPLAYFSAGEVTSAATLNALMDSYRTETGGARQVVSLNGQRIAYAPPAKPGDTEFETASLTFDALKPMATVPVGTAPFFPYLKQGRIRLAAVAQLAQAGGDTVDIGLAAPYLVNGFDAAKNMGQVFIKLISGQPVMLPAKSGGGIAAPDLTIQGLSRAWGLVGGDLGELAKGHFDPKSFFDGSAKLLGAISLKALVAELTATALDQLSGRVPQTISRMIRDGLGRQTAVETVLTWDTPMQKVSELGVTFAPASGSKLTIEARLTAPLDGTAPTYSVVGTLGKFTVDLFGLVNITFGALQVVQKSGSKPDVDMDMGAVQFTGALEWVSELAGFLAGLGKGGLSIGGSDQAISVGTTVGPLSIQLGMLTLSNVKLATELTLPLGGSSPVALAFDFARPDSPFIVTVSMLGGGGYFGITLTTAGITRIAGGFEFGGAVALDLGVASGGVSIMAGIYIAWESGNAKYSGYLRCSGSLSVLGLVTLSVLFNMSLDYDPGLRKVVGTAKVEVKIHIAFFEKSVSLTLRRQFAGSAADPTFTDLVGQTEWDRYCEAFA